MGDGPAHGLRLDADDGPGIGGQDNHSDVSAGEILLKRKILIASDEGVETRVFGFTEQSPVAEASPAHLEGCSYDMSGQDAAQLPGSVLVEQDSHPLEGG